jgi:hypothetical protein
VGVVIVSIVLTTTQFIEPLGVTLLPGPHSTIDSELELVEIISEQWHSLDGCLAACCVIATSHDGFELGPITGEEHWCPAEWKLPTRVVMRPNLTKSSFGKRKDITMEHAHFIHDQTRSLSQILSYLGVTLELGTVVVSDTLRY